MSSAGKCRVVFVCLTAIVIGAAAPLMAAETAAKDSRLSDRQRLVRQRFEALLADMHKLAEILEETEPENAVRLKEAVKAARENLIGGNMQKLIDALRTKKLDTAKGDAEKVVKSLRKMLEILTADETQFDEDVREFRDLHAMDKELGKLIEAEKGALGKTRQVAAAKQALAGLAGASQKLKALIKGQGENLGKTKQLKEGKGGEAEKKAAADAQKKMTGEAEGLEKELKEIEKALKEAGGSEGAEQVPMPGAKSVAAAGKSVGSASKSMGSAAGKLDKGDPKGAEPDEKKALDDLKKAETELEKLKKELEDFVKKNTPPGRKSDQEKIRKETEQFAKGGGKGGEPSETEKEARKHAESAAGEMKKAEGELGKGESGKPGGKQKKAVDELEKAREAVRKRMKEMEEEFQEDLLAQLEALLKKMLTAQRALNKGTQSVDHAITARKGQRLRADELELKRLGEGQTAIAKDAVKAQGMLEADGSSMVLLSVMEDTHDLMANVAERLATFKSGSHTQGLEKDIERSLEDMLAAVQEERRRRDEMAQEAENGEGQEGQGQKQQKPLIQLSAELKMLKALQLRVNTRTLSLDGARPKLKPPEVTEQAARLARRQARVGRMTRDLSNKLKAERALGGAEGI